jgi:aspartate aminotransferase-like enzyme
METGFLDAQEDMLLLVPGPTPVPGRVLRAQSRPMMNHRCPAFHELLFSVTSGLASCFRTSTQPLVLTASGTGGLEAAVVNTLSPGDKVLAVVTGEFGARFAEIARLYGAEVTRIDVEWGRAADPAVVESALAGAGYKAVLCTLNETSTGVVNPVEAIAKAAKAAGALVLVDAISGLLATPCETDAWGLDVVVAGSQKAFMIPPGLAFVTMSEAAWAASEQATMPRFYFDLARAQKTLAKGENPWTPAVSLLYALHEALDMIQAEGLDNALARHLRLRDGVRAGAAVLGFAPVATDDVASPAVTSFWPPNAIEGDALRKVLRSRYGIELAGGQGHLKGKIVRVGHLGYVGEQQILQGISLMAMGLGDMGCATDAAVAVAAAREAMAR